MMNVPCSIVGGSVDVSNPYTLTFAGTGQWEYSASVPHGDWGISEIQLNYSGGSWSMIVFVVCPSGDSFFVTMSGSATCNPLSGTFSGTISTEANCCNGITLTIHVSE